MKSVKAVLYILREKLITAKHFYMVAITTYCTILVWKNDFFTARMWKGKVLGPKYSLTYQCMLQKLSSDRENCPMGA